MISSVHPSVRQAVCPSVCLSVICDAISQTCYSDELLISTECASYGSPHLKRLWSRSVDFQIFCEFSNFSINFSPPLGNSLTIFASTVLPGHLVLLASYQECVNYSTSWWSISFFKSATRYLNFKALSFT